MTPAQIEQIINAALKDGISLQWWSYLAIVILAFFGGFLGAYFNKRAQNIAIKKDVSKITELIEQVKKNFNEDLEGLKSTLNVKSTTQLSLLNEERQAIIDFYISYFDWFLSNTSMPPDATSSDNKVVQEYRQIISQKYLKLQRCEAAFELFIEDEKLVLEKINLKQKTVKTISIPVINFLSDIQLNNLKYNSIYNKFVEAPNREKLQELNKELETIREAKIKIYEEFSEKIIAANVELYHLQQNFLKHSRDYLYQIIKESKSNINTTE